MAMQRRDLLKMSTTAPFLATPLSALSKLPDGTQDESQAKLTKEPFGDLRIYYEGSTDQLKTMTAGSLRLKPGASPHPPHVHPEEEFMVVTEGTGEISVNGNVTKVGP